MTLATPLRTLIKTSQTATRAPVRGRWQGPSRSAAPTRADPGDGHDVDAKPTQQVARPELARQAEGLLRCLAGVSHARVLAGDHGIDAIHVVAADHAVAPGLAVQIRSALLAGLATPILPARIHVRVHDDDVDGEEHRQDDYQAAATVTGHRLRLLDHMERRAARPQELHITPGRHARPLEPVDPAGSEQPDELDPVALPRLVSVDLDRRDDGRILCRVAIAYRTRVHSDEALAVDLPGAAAHAAAQAAVRALVRAGLHGLELDGLREVEIAGRDYALVALRRSDTSRRVRSGSAPISGSAERAAALAAVAAAKELL